MEEHWELLGDLKVTPNTYAQAMVKREHYGGIDSNVLVTIEELDGIKFAVESIGEAIQDVVGAMGHIAAGVSDNPTKRRNHKTHEIHKTHKIDRTPQFCGSAPLSFRAFARLAGTPDLAILHSLKVFRIDQPHRADFRRLQTLGFNQRPDAVLSYS